MRFYHYRWTPDEGFPEIIHVPCVMDGTVIYPRRRVERSNEMVA